MEWKSKLYDYEVPPPESVWGKICHDLDGEAFVTFKQKLFHQEVTPPENLWSKIDHELDSEALITFKQQLFHQEATPPESVWSKIDHDLDSEALITFKQQLFHQEITPPESVWSKIDHDLDNDSFVVFKQKLFHEEQAPPSEAWKNIEQAIHPEPVVVPFAKRNTFKVWRMAAAAAVIGIAFVTVNYFLSQTDTVTLPVAKKPAINTPATPAPANKQSVVTGPKIVAATVARQKSRSNISRNNANISAVAYNNNDGNTVIASLSTIPDENSSFTDRLDLSTETNRRIRNLHGEIKEDVSLLDLPNSYFLMTGPNGQTVRVSSKFRNTIQYLNGNNNHEELLDVILRESHYWKNIFSEWKVKVGNSSFVPSSQNFMGIADLMSLLEQNRNNK
ncbi:MAG: hypothetical protein ACTHLE_22720 [Agriterribacter sp.]